MASINRVILIGYAGQTPDLKHSAAGAPVVNMSIATNEKWKDREGDRKERTEWHNIVLWNRLAEVADELVRKGSQVYVEGRLQYRSWKDKDGYKHHATDIVANRLLVLDNSAKESKEPTPYASDE